jgi:hypothetical protein
MMRMMSGPQIGSERWFFHKVGSNQSHGPFTISQLFDEASSNALTPSDVVTLADRLRDYTEWHPIASAPAGQIAGFISPESKMATIHFQVDPIEAMLSFLLPPITVYCNESQIWSGSATKGGTMAWTTPPGEYTFKTVFTKIDEIHQVVDANSHYFLNVTPSWWSGTNPFVVFRIHRPVAAAVEHNAGYYIPFPDNACLTNRMNDHRRFVKCSNCFADLSLALVGNKKRKETFPTTVPINSYEMRQVLAIKYTRRFIYECIHCGRRCHEDVVDEWVP